MYPRGCATTRHSGPIPGDGQRRFSSGGSGIGLTAGTLFSCRGVHIGGLALVKPSNVPPKTYTNLTLPLTAPVSTGSTAHPPPSVFQPHMRSASETVNVAGSRNRLHHKSSRNVGIVGLSSASRASKSFSPASPTSAEYHIYAQNSGFGVPICQIPRQEPYVLLRRHYA